MREEHQGSRQRHRFLLRLALTRKCSQREIKLLDQSAGQAAAIGRAAVVCAGVQEEITLGSQTQEMVAEHAVDGFIEAHDVQGGLDETPFDPESGKARHSRYAASRAIGVV
jgi:hypothetical protein